MSSDPASCEDVLAWLSAVDAGEPLPDPVVDGLVRRGWAQRVAPPSGADEDGARLREALVAVRSERAALVATLPTAGEGARAAAKERIAALDADERLTRSALLELASLPASAALAPALTFVGRDLRGELASRTARARGLSIDAFLHQLSALRATLDATAGTAARLLAALSPQVELEEHDLRAVVIGLAAHPSGEALGPRFSAAEQAVRDRAPLACRALAAEALARNPGDPVTLTALAVRELRAACASDEDAWHAAVIAWDPDPQVRGATVARGRAIAARWAAGIKAPAWLLADADATEAAVDEVPGLEAQIRDVDPDPVAARWAAVFLALSPGSFDRWRAVREWLARWGTDGITAAAAMLVLVDGPPSELLDDLRLASAAVRSAKLSLHAVENLALGVKLLVEVAQRDGRAPQSVALGHLSAGATLAPLPVGRLSPRFPQAFATFHAATVHRQVAWQARHHALHTHTVYG